MIGNRAISTVTITRAWKSKPNSPPMSGTSARMGIVCRTTAHGKNERSTHRLKFIATAKSIPAAAAMARPVNDSLAVTAKPSRNSPRTSASLAAAVHTS